MKVQFYSVLLVTLASCGQKNATFQNALETPTSTKLSADSTVSSPSSVDVLVTEVKTVTETKLIDSSNSNRDVNLGLSQDLPAEFNFSLEKNYLKGGESTKLNSEVKNIKKTYFVEYAIVFPLSGSLGSISNGVYTAPTTILPSNTLVKIRARYFVEGKVAFEKTNDLALVPDQAFVTPCVESIGSTLNVSLFDLTSKIPVGWDPNNMNYALTESMFLLPFSNVTSVTLPVPLCMKNIDVPEMNWEAGFPGATGIKEWFGLTISGKIYIDTPGVYKFTAKSDDGSMIFIDGTPVMNNDGGHAHKFPLDPTNQTITRGFTNVHFETPITLTQGYHDFKMEYFQGPRAGMGVQAYWQKPGGILEIIPESVFKIQP